MNKEKMAKLNKNKIIYCYENKKFVKYLLFLFLEKKS